MGFIEQHGSNLKRLKYFKGKKIKYSITFLSKFIFIFFITLLSVMTCVLYREYTFFKRQSNKMLELQQDYRTYIGAVNKILSDYNKVKEKLEDDYLFQYSNQDSKKKNNNRKIDKNDKSDTPYFYGDFPQLYKDGNTSLSVSISECDCECPYVYSSADNYFESFFLINRDLKYLRDSALSFINNQSNSNALLDSIDWSDWCEYTDYGLSKISVSGRIRKRAKEIKTSERRVKKFAPKLKKTKKVACYASLHSDSHETSRKKFDLANNQIRLSWPIERSRFWISSLFGPRKKRSGAWGFHYGVDMAALKGTPVCAAHTGIVVEARYASGYGNTIVIAFSRKYRTRYAHLSKILVRVGQKIRRGKTIGRVGDTGYVRSSQGHDASHLHFELIEFGKKINPLPFIS